MQEATTEVVGGLAGIGAAIGLGQLMLSGEPLTARRVVGRAVVSAGLGLAAGGVLTLVPGLPLIGLCGIAAGLASLGTSGLERLIKRWVDKRAGVSLDAPTGSPDVDGKPEK